VAEYIFSQALNILDKSIKTMPYLKLHREKASKIRAELTKGEKAGATFRTRATWIGLLRYVSLLSVIASHLLIFLITVYQTMKSRRWMLALHLGRL
jgi:hypothetical protein